MIDENLIIESVEWVENHGIRDAQSHIEMWRDRGSTENLRLAANALQDAAVELYSLNADLLDEIAQAKYGRNYTDLSLSQQGAVQEDRDIYLAERAREEQEGRL